MLKTTMYIEAQRQHHSTWYFDGLRRPFRYTKMNVERKSSEEQREHYIEQLEATLQKAYDRLLKTQERYKRDFDKRTEPEPKHPSRGQCLPGSDGWYHER